MARQRISMVLTACAVEQLSAILFVRGLWRAITDRHPTRNSIGTAQCVNKAIESRSRSEATGFYIRLVFHEFIFHFVLWGVCGVCCLKWGFAAMSVVTSVASAATVLGITLFWT
eukprot:EG_transcript_18336